MSWDWVKDYPIFVYTTWLNHNIFHVKLVKGEKGNQNAPGFGPNAPAWKEYVQRGISSKDKVVDLALKIAKRTINIEKKQWVNK